MGLLVDIIILIIMALCIFIGYKRGLIKCAINVLSFFVAIIVVILLTTPVSNLIINNTKIDDNIRETILGKLDIGNLSDGQMELNENSSNLPEVVREYINNLMIEINSTTTGDVAQALAENISVMIINVAVAIILFIGTKLALVFVKVLADIIGKIPLLKQFNKAGGIIYGVAKGIVTIYLLLAVISIIIPLLSNTFITDAINQSMIGKAMYDNNILLKIFL